jgi:hypothetical protein
MTTRPKTPNPISKRRRIEDRCVIGFAAESVRDDLASSVLAVADASIELGLLWSVISVGIE